MKNMFIAIFFAILCVPSAYGEEPVPTETTEEVAPTPTEEVESAEETKTEPAPVESEEKGLSKKEEAKEEAKETKKVPETDMEAIKDAYALWKAIESQDWSLAGGLFIMLLVYVFNRFGLKDKIGGKAIPFVSLALGVLTAIGIALASGGSLPAALEAGVLAGLAAIGSWEVLFKKVLGGSSEATEEAA